MFKEGGFNRKSLGESGSLIIEDQGASEALFIDLHLIST